MTTLMLDTRGECEVLMALDLDRKDSEERTAIMFSVYRGVGEMVMSLARSPSY